MSCVHILPPSLTNIGTLGRVPIITDGKLAVYITDQPVPDVKIPDENALLDHFTWPQNVTVSVIAESMGSCLRCGTNNYHPPLTLSSHKMCQDRYLDVS